MSDYVPRIWPQDEILQAAKEWAAWAGRSPSWTDWNKKRVHGEPRRPATQTVSAAFGSWLGMIRAAGLPPATVGAPCYWTRERVIDCLLDHVAVHGRFPRRADWLAASPDHPQRTQVIRRFGTWSAAIREARGGAAEGRWLVEAAPVVAAVFDYMGSGGSAASVASLVGVDVARINKLLSGERVWIEHRTADQILSAIDRPGLLATLASAENGAAFRVVEPTDEGSDARADGNAARAVPFVSAEKAA